MPSNQLSVLTFVVAALVCQTGGSAVAHSERNEPGSWSGDALIGQPVDLAPWCYEWRAGRAVQPQPEAAFIPRRLDRLERIYRTARRVLPPDQLKSIYYNMPDLLAEFPPSPRGELAAGFLWTGGLVDCAVELRWPQTGPVPDPGSVEVRSYPTSFGWFGFTLDRVLGSPTVSADGRTWTYHTPVNELMDSSYNARVPAATEMIALFSQSSAGSRRPAPAVRITSPAIGRWRRIDIELEWGFQEGGESRSFAARLEPSVAHLGPIEALAGDSGTTVSGCGWRSGPTGAGRRGVTLPVLYAPDARAGLDSRITVRSAGRAVTFSIHDLERGPIMIPGFGLFVCRAGSGETARSFAESNAAAGRRALREMTREHREPASWEELMREVRLWTCPATAAPAPLPPVKDPPMEVDVSDRGWTDAWRAAANQLTGEHMWGGLAFEVARVTHTMDLIGLNRQSEKVYRHFLDGPGAKPDGDYVDGRGALEWATSLRHDMGYSHDGTHASTGRLLYSMAERCILNADREWFMSNLPRLRAAADWIIRQRTAWMHDLPNRSRLHVAGLMPPCMLGDYAIPSCDWHWYYVDNALAVQGLQRFADALALFKPADAASYGRAARDYRRDLRRVVEREAGLSPVRRGRDGLYRSFVPRMAYARGLTGPELGAPQFPDTDIWMGSLALAEPGAGLEASDALVRDTLDVMEEMGQSAAAIAAEGDGRRNRGLTADDAWFWHSYSILPKASHTANTYLLQDDIPGFLRFWMNSYAAMVGADGKLWEHSHLGGFDVCASPDNGTAGWFLENFRNMLVMEQGGALWIARGAPRAWLAPGHRIAVSNAPTYFGPLSYAIHADAASPRITATLHLPTRAPARTVILRLRHPDAKPISSVTVNGRRWTRFDAAGELIRLSGLRGDVTVIASY